jgi:hypothetical protein
MRLQSGRINMLKTSAAMLTCHVCREPFNNNVLDRCPNCDWDAGHLSEGGHTKPDLTIKPSRKVEIPFDHPIPLEVRRVASAKIQQQAQAFFPSHAYDQNFRMPIDTRGQFMNPRQQQMIDLVLNNSASPSHTANPSSQLLEMIMNPTKFLGDNNISTSAKKLLYEAFEKSNLITEGVNGRTQIELSEAVSEQHVNSLKAEGLISGMGRTCNLTEKGRKALVKMMLDSEAQITAHTVSKLVKTASHQPLKQQIRGDGVKVVRDKEGNWVEQPDIEQELREYSSAKLQALYGTVLKAEASNSNIPKLAELKAKIRKALEERA